MNKKSKILRRFASGVKYGNLRAYPLAVSADRPRSHGRSGGRNFSQNLIDLLPEKEHNNVLVSRGRLVSTGHVEGRLRAEGVCGPRKSHGQNLNANNDFALAA